MASLMMAGWLASAAAAAAQEPAPGDTGTRLKKVQRALDANRAKEHELGRRAAGLAREVRRLRRESVAAARRLQEHEAEVLRLEVRLEELARREVEKTDDLVASRGRFANVLVALERLARYPPEALIVQPLGPTETVRSAILLRAAVPRLQERAGRLRAGLLGLARTRRETTERHAQLAAATAALWEERPKLDALLARKASLQRRTEGESRAARKRAKALSRQARDLRDLMARLEKERIKRERLTKQRLARESLEREARARREAAQATAQEVAQAAAQAAAQSAARKAARSMEPAAPVRPISQARGNLPFPVVGRLVGRYGEPTKSGLSRKGLSIESGKQAQVVATYAGRVVFAGVFRGYGQLLIIEHGEGYHSLLAGMARIDVIIGQHVLAGEPVGVMGRPEGGKPTLYVELRRNGQSINPLPWLAAHKDKVSG